MAANYREGAIGGRVQPRPLLPVAEKEPWGENLSFFFDLSFFLTRRKNLFYQMFLKILWLHIMYMTYIYGFKKYCNDVHLIYASVFYQMERKYYIK